MLKIGSFLQNPSKTIITHTVVQLSSYHFPTTSFPFKGMHLACCGLRCSVTHLTVPMQAENTNPLFLKYLIITAESSYSPLHTTLYVLHLLWKIFTAIMQKDIFLSEHVFKWKWKKVNIRGCVLRMQKLLQGIMCYFKILASQHCTETTCLRRSQEKKRLCLSEFGNYVAFPLLGFPMGLCNSTSPSSIACSIFQTGFLLY